MRSKLFAIGLILVFGIADASSAFAASSVSTTPLLTVETRAMAVGSVPRGAQRVPFLSMKLTASCARAVAVSSVTVTHEGLGRMADLLRVYGMDGVRRLTRAVSFSNREKTAVLRFSAFSIPACGSRTITVMADIASDAAAASEHRLVLKSEREIDAGGVPVLVSAAQGNSAAVRLVPSDDATVAIEYLPVLTSVTYGSKRTVSRFRLRSSGSRAQEISSITFTNDGSARDADLQKFFVESSRGDVLSDIIPSMDGDGVRVTFSPALSLAKNEEKILYLKADIRASRRRTIRFLIEEPSDIEIGVGR